METTDLSTVYDDRLHTFSPPSPQKKSHGNVSITN